MLSDEIRRRLAALHEAKLPADVSHQSAVLPARNHSPAIGVAPDSCLFGPDVFDRGWECENASGKHWRLRYALAQLWPQAEATVARATRGGRTPPTAIHPELSALADCFPADTLFLDLETCGFAGSAVFLAGLLWFDGSLIVDQLFARTYAEEKALLTSLWQIAARNRLLVTFNGKSFDWPMVHDRSTRHHLGRDGRSLRRARTATPRPSHDPSERIPAGDELARDSVRPQLLHCDLLHHARRRWKRVLPDCRLQTLERYVCRRVRHDDLPGALVPAAYHEFVRNGRTDQIGAILQHNALDLVTLAHLACRLLADSRAAQGSGCASDIPRAKIA